MLTITSPPLKGAGGMFITITSPRLADRHISPFEGGWGDVYIKGGCLYKRMFYILMFI